MIAHTFLHNPMVHESGPITMSAHKTKTGAYRAMREWLRTESLQHRDRQIEFGSWGNEKFGSYEWWGIGQIEILE